MITKERKGNWFHTFSGIQFYPLDPRPEDINIEDIAKGLSNTCRFNGHVIKFYSVAQHSVLVSRIVPDEYALEGLLHDGSESYLGDMVRPLKYSLPEYRIIEDKVEECIANKYGLIHPWPECVKEADNILLMTERRDLMNAIGDWRVYAEPMDQKIEAWDPERSYEEFMTRFKELWQPGV